MQSARVTPVEALRVLVQAGATDRLLAVAVRELLAEGAPDPAQSARTGRPMTSVADATAREDEPRERSTSPSPDSRRASPVMPAAPASAIARAEPIRKAPPPPPSGQREKLVVINYKSAEGKRTSTFLTAARWETLLSFQPDEAELRRIVRDLCQTETVPLGLSRPDWVFEELFVRLSKRIS